MRVKRQVGGSGDSRDKPKIKTENTRKRIIIGTRFKQVSCDHLVIYSTRIWSSDRA